MKNDEFKNSKEFNKISEYKKLNSENYNSFEYNKKLKEYLKVNEMNNPNNPNSNIHNENLFDKNKSLKDDADKIKKLSHSLKHSLSTIATTVGSSAVVVAASAAIVSNAFVPNPKINFDFVSSYDSISYEVEMNNVDETLDYFILLENNGSSFRVDLPKDDNPDDHIITYNGVYENLDDNELYYFNIFGQDNEKGSTSKFYNTKIMTAKYDLPEVKFDFKSNFNERNNEATIAYKVLFDKYNPKKKVSYRLKVYKGEEILVNNVIFNGFVSGTIKLDENEFKEIYENTNPLIFEVIEVKKGLETLVNKCIYDSSYLQPTVIVNSHVSLDESLMNLVYKYKIELTKFTLQNESNRIFNLVIKYKDNILYEDEFSENIFEGNLVLPTDVTKELLNNKNEFINILVSEVTNDKTIPLKSTEFNLENYQTNVDFNVDTYLQTNRDTIIVDYDVLLENFHPSTVSNYKLVISYKGNIIFTDSDFLNSKFKNIYSLPQNIVNEILTGPTKELSIDVYEVNSKETLLSSHKLDYSKFMLNAFIGLNPIYHKDDVTMDLDYNININGDISLFKEFKVYVYRNGIKEELQDLITTNNYQGIIKNVEEGQIKLTLVTLINNNPIIIGEKELEIIYPPVDLSTATIQTNVSYNKELRESTLTITPNINEAKVKDSYKVEVRNNNTLIKQFTYTDTNKFLSLNNLLKGTYNIKLIEHKAGVDYIISETNYDMTYPDSFFTNIVSANPVFTPVFDGVNKVTQLKINPNVLNKYIDNLYYMVITKANYYTNTTTPVKLNEFNEIVLNDLTPGTYNIKIYIKEIYQDSVIYDGNYEYIYPQNHLVELLEPTFAFTEIDNIPEKKIGVNIAPTILDKFSTARFKIHIHESQYGYDLTSPEFSAKDNYELVIEHLLDTEYQVDLIMVLEGKEEVIYTEAYYHSYPHDFDPLPDTTPATFDRIVSGNVRIDANTKPGFLILHIPLNYSTPNENFYYEAQVYDGQFLLGETGPSTEKDAVIEIEDGYLDRANLYIDLKVRENWRYKTIETYSVPGDLYLGGPKMTIQEPKLVEEGLIVMPYRIDYANVIEKLNSITYTAIFNDGYKVTNSCPIDSKNGEFKMTGFDHAVTGMTVTTTINYVGGHSMGEREKVIEETYTFPTAPILKRSLVKAGTARNYDQTDVELDFLYFGPVGLDLVIEDANTGAKLHQGGLNYVGPLDNETTTYMYYLVDKQGNRVGTTEQIDIDASGYPYYTFNDPTADDILITENADGTYNYYIDFNFQTMSQTNYYMVKFYDRTMGDAILYKQVSSRSKVFVLENAPRCDYDIKYQIYDTDRGVNYIYLADNLIELGRKMVNSFISFNHLTTTQMEFTFKEGLEFDNNTVVVHYTDGTTLQLNSTDFVVVEPTTSKVTVDCTKEFDRITLKGSLYSKQYDLISSKVQVKGNKLMDIEMVLPR